MKKIYVLIYMFLGLFAFSKDFNDGRYSVIKKDGNVTIEMTMIVKNEKILSLSFDKKINGISQYVGENSKEISRITREIRENKSTKNIKSNLDKNTNENIKELFEFLCEKSSKSQEGKYEIGNQ